MIDNISRHEKTTAEDYNFSILIPSWNNLDYLKPCINSIKKNSALRIQIIVFVNDGTDGTLAWLADQEEIDYLHASENVGICYALNLSRSMVKSDYMVYLNDDMYVLPNWDVELNNAINQIDTKLFMLSATMISPVDIKNNCDIVKNYGNTIEDFDEDLLLKEYESLSVKDWSGSSWPPNVVHKDIWDLVGGYSVEFSPGMYSDPDFTKKLYELGVRTFKGIGTSLVYHFTSKSTKKIKQSNGRHLFLLKWRITANVFYKKVLNIGEPYSINTGKPVSFWDVFMGKMKIFFVLFKSSK